MRCRAIQIAAVHVLARAIRAVLALSMGKLGVHAKLPHLSRATRLMIQEQAFALAPNVVAMVRNYKTLVLC